MKYIKKFDTVSALNTAIATTTVDLLGTAYNGSGVVVKVKRGPLAEFPPYDEIWYTSTDGSKVVPYTQNNQGELIYYGANYVDAESSYDSVADKGVMKFDGPIFKIGDGAFEGYETLASISLPESVREIGSHAFYECWQLTSVDLPSSIITIREYAFYGSGVKNVTIPDGVTEIGEYAFYGSFIESLILPGSVALGNYALDMCENLESLTIPNGVRNIGSLFDGCSKLKSLIIPNSVHDTTLVLNQYNAMETIKIHTLCQTISVYTCHGPFSSISVDIANTTYDSRGNCNAIIETATNKLVLGGVNTVIPNTVTSIGDNAFSSRISLTSITIPNSVTNIGDNAFYYCPGLTSLTIPDSVTSIGHAAFAECSSLASITCEPTTPPTLLRGSAFYNTNNCPIYVPAASVEAYKAASGWSNYTSRIYAIPS